MSLARQMKDRVVIETPSPLAVNNVNEYGDEDETHVEYWDSLEVRAYVFPTASGEDETDRETVTRGWDVYLDSSTAIDANCRVRIIVAENDEQLCRVIGAPITYRTSHRGASHTLVKVEAVNG